jgi:CheY-like chemotaxis protein
VIFVTHILVVEDDQSLNLAYKTILEASGYNVETACNGQEALLKLNDYRPNLILLDLLMPIMDGLEFLKKYQPKENKNTAVLLFTNMESSPGVEEAYKLGIRAVIVKSMTSPAQLTELVKNTLKS